MISFITFLKCNWYACFVNLSARTVKLDKKLLWNYCIVGRVPRSQNGLVLLCYVEKSWYLLLSTRRRVGISRHFTISAIAKIHGLERRHYDPRNFEFSLLSPLNYHINSIIITLVIIKVISIDFFTYHNFSHVSYISD